MDKEKNLKEFREWVKKNYKKYPIGYNAYFMLRTGDDAYFVNCKETFTNYFWSNESQSFRETKDSFLIVKDNVLRWWNELNLPSLEDYLCEIREKKTVVFDNTGLFKYPIYLEILFILRRMAFYEDNHFDVVLANLNNSQSYSGVKGLMESLKLLTKEQLESITSDMASVGRENGFAYGFIASYRYQESKFRQLINKYLKENTSKTNDTK